jgi:hypothetical protein
LFAFVRACALALGWGGNDWNDLVWFGLLGLFWFSEVGGGGFEFGWPSGKAFQFQLNR